MSSTAIRNVTTRPVIQVAGHALAQKSTGLSTGDAPANGNTLDLGYAAFAISAQVIVSSAGGSTTVGSTAADITIQGSLASSAGWTTLSTATVSSTQAGTVYVVQPASTAALAVTHLRSQITGLSTVGSSSGTTDVTVWLGII